MIKRVCSQFVKNDKNSYIIYVKFCYIFNCYRIAVYV